MTTLRRHARIRLSWSDIRRIVDPITGRISQLVPSVSAEYNPGEYDWLFVDNADRIIDWTYAGVPNGIPTRTTIYASLGVSGQSPSYVQGVTATQINDAISACPYNQVVYLNQGTYNLSAQVVFTSKSGVTLRGAGPGHTNLNFSVGSAVRIGTTATFYTATEYSISGDIPKGATTLTLSSSPPAAATVGGLFQISELADYDLMWHRDSPNYGPRCHYFIARITAINGNTISFTPPNPYGFRASLTPLIKFKPVSVLTSLCGIENLTLDGTSNIGLYLDESDRCWAYKVEVKNFDASEGMVMIRRSVQHEIRTCYVHDTVGYEGADGYGINHYDYSNYGLDIDNITNRTAAAHRQFCSSANVVAYNYAYLVHRTSDANIYPGMNCTHAPHGLMTLIEGNIFPSLENDGYHGSTSHQFMFRNHFHGTQPDGRTGCRWLVTLARAAYYHSAVGNIFGDPSWTPSWYELTDNPGSTSCIYKLEYPNSGNMSYTPAMYWPNWTATFPNDLVKNNLLRHGNYDYYNHAVMWTPTISDHSMPNSLFLSSKPSWFGALPWPNIDPLTHTAGDNPAKLRWNTYQVSGILDDLFV